MTDGCIYRSPAKDAPLQHNCDSMFIEDMILMNVEDWIALKQWISKQQ
jgi:hypothetical protein